MERKHRNLVSLLYDFLIGIYILLLAVYLRPDTGLFQNIQKEINLLNTIAQSDLFENISSCRAFERNKNAVCKRKRMTTGEHQHPEILSPNKRQMLILRETHGTDNKGKKVFRDSQ